MQAVTAPPRGPAEVYSGIPLTQDGKQAIEHSELVTNR